MTSKSFGRINMNVSDQDRQAMARLLNIVDGAPADQIEKTPLRESSNIPVELAGPGMTTRADVNAMADVITRLNSLSNDVIDNMITESATQPESGEALQTERTQTGVKIGRYQILIKEDADRRAGKQFYSIYNSLTNDTIADDISLYETALTVVRLLNSGKFANSQEIRQMFEHDDAYTAHRVDAILYKRKMATAAGSKRDIFESRYQASLDRCMAAKKQIKMLAK